MSFDDSIRNRRSGAQKKKKIDNFGIYGKGEIFWQIKVYFQEHGWKYNDLKTVNFMASRG